MSIAYNYADWGIEDRIRLFGTDGQRTFELAERYFDGKNFHIIETLQVHFTFSDDCRDATFNEPD